VKAEEVGVLEEANEVSFRSLLQRDERGGGETEVVLESGGNITDKALEGELADEEISGLLVSTDLTDSDGTGTVTVRLLDTTGGGSGLADGLRDALFIGYTI
jgi:hypothetical protein